MFTPLGPAVKAVWSVSRDLAKVPAPASGCVTFITNASIVTSLPHHLADSWNCPHRPPGSKRKEINHRILHRGLSGVHWLVLPFADQNL